MNNMAGGRPSSYTQELGEIVEEQLENNCRVPKQLQPFMYKKGQSGNPKGRPEGISMKEYIRMKFRHMTDEEREEFLEGINKLDILKMAEGNPENKTDVTSDGKAINGNTVIFKEFSEDETNS